MGSRIDRGARIGDCAGAGRRLRMLLASALLCVGAAASLGGPAWAQSLEPTPNLVDENGAPTKGPTAVVDRMTGALRAAFAGGRGQAIDAAIAAQREPLLKDLAGWSQLRDASVDDWSDLSDFVRRRPHWPGVSALRTRAENVMPEGLSAAKVTDFFKETPPRTARGARLLGQALIAAGRVSEGSAWIVTAWRERTMNRSEEEIFLDRHNALIEPHHPTRARMLFWRERLRAASRMAPLMSQEERRLATTKATLYRGRGDLRALVASVPDGLRDDPGLAFAQMMWRAKRKQHDAVETAIVAASEAGALGDPKAWAKRRLYYAREAFEEDRPGDAYSLATDHGLTQGVDFADLEWFAGWMALTRLNAPDAALSRFETMWRGVTTPISRARAAYWAGEAAAAMNDRKTAATWRWRAAEHPNVFYGQLAAERLRADGPSFLDPAEPGPTPLEELSEADQSLAMAAATLYRLGRQRDGRRFAEALAERRKNRPGLLRAADVARSGGDVAGSIKVAKIARGKGVALWDAMYPLPEAPQFEGRAVEPALLLAVARQESAFQPSAQSGAGAIGLMQMMPRTARVTAKRAGVRFDRRRLAADPNYNLTLADAHLLELLAQYRGSYVLSIAAYNAGGGNVARWIERFGDPRDYGVDPVTWIESIPFSETRNYVQRVLETTQVYRVRLRQGPRPMRLASDLSR